MTFHRLMWIFAGLFLLFGFPLLMIEDKAWLRILVSLCCLSLFEMCAWLSWCVRMLTRVCVCVCERERDRGGKY